ncbi:hypothetical protein Tco_0389895 [Tanacetum coccineum]
MRGARGRAYAIDGGFKATHQNPTAPFAAILKPNAALGLRPNPTHRCGAILLNQPAPLFCCRGTTETNTPSRGGVGLSTHLVGDHVTVQTHLLGLYTKTNGPRCFTTTNVTLDPWWFKTTRTLGRWRLLSGGGGVVVDGDDGVGYDDDGDGEVAVMVVLAAVGQQPERMGREKARVGRVEVDGGVNRVTVSFLKLTGKLRRKSFPVAAPLWPAVAGWPAVGEGCRNSWGGREYINVCVYNLRWK